MAAKRLDENRKGKLRSYFAQINRGDKTIASSSDAKRFVEAICVQTDVVRCAEQLVATSHGLKSLQTAVVVDTSLQYLNSVIKDVLGFIARPEIKLIGGGDFHARMLTAIADPPIMLKAMTSAFQKSELSKDCQLCYAKLILELLLLPKVDIKPYVMIAQDENTQNMFLKSEDHDTRFIGYKIKGILDTLKKPVTKDEAGPGGRHDNDFSDFREIDIFPTADEIMAREPPFLRFESDLQSVAFEDRFAVHLDSQFRLNREDMLRSMREEIQTASTSKKATNKGVVAEGINLAGIVAEDGRPWALKLECSTDLPQLPKEKGQLLWGSTDLPYLPKKNGRLLWVQKNKNFLKHDSFACVLYENCIVGFVQINRNEDLLARKPPIIVARPVGNLEVVQKMLLCLKQKNDLKLRVMNTAVFAYEHVLRQLQEIKELPLKNDVLGIANENYQGNNIFCDIPKDITQDFQTSLELEKPVNLDAYQLACFNAAITQRLSLIQGPPGTGKSFIGALIAKALLKYTLDNMLVICYTNHALDQFIDDLRGVAISENDIVRLGNPKKSSLSHSSLLLSNQRASFRPGWAHWETVNARKLKVDNLKDELLGAFSQFEARSVKKEEIMAAIEFDEPLPSLFEALEVPQNDGDMRIVGSRGKAIDQYYLLDRWAKGNDPGIFKENAHKFPKAWGIQREERLNVLAKIKEGILTERALLVAGYGSKYCEAIEEKEKSYQERDRMVLQSKRVICCTTTAAAKYTDLIHHAKPGIVLVEEAGEILESHVLTALGPSTEKLILIGDHKQLRPKAHFDLSVEKGSGYNLNRSMFERLVLADHPHSTLSQQHRMRPEISRLVRQLTYPELTDAPSTLNRKPLRGFQCNLMFITHNHLEETQDAPDYRDNNSTSSKKNSFEAKMTLKCVRYLAQQGYGTDKIVVLTPYLGQLRLLYDVLKQENDPVLNDLDYHDLIQANLIPAAASNIQKKELKISTIDNYQGEESDIVLVSLTRSNERGEIGFMAAPERLNVLLSRARDALIMIGNGATFAANKKRDSNWPSLIRILKEELNLFDGFPIKCERHPSATAILQNPADFDHYCPDGGCMEPCGTMLNCELHRCPSKCHQIHDHSKIKCRRPCASTCQVGHNQRWECHEGSPSQCKTCDKIQEQHLRQLKRDLERQQALETIQREHDARMQALEDEKDQLKLLAINEEKRRQMEEAWENKKQELNQAREMRTRASKLAAQKSAKVELDPIADSSLVKDVAEKTPSEVEWKRQKEIDGASNPQVDTLMEMTGLENVKAEFLNIMAKIETIQRQGTDVGKERFGVSLLGNPGTGKTTVARLYAKLLFSLDVIPGAEFVETTGSSLAHEGVSGAKKILDGIVQAGGGAVFIDEAYQLVSGNSLGGTAVLDYLLAEIENQTGKIVFIFAGYNKQMEKFYEHNQGIESRLPYRLQFDDYTDAELLCMFQRSLKKRFKGRMEVEDGVAGLYARIAIRRLGRGRGKEGFGNARALENLIARMLNQQSMRLIKERASGEKRNDLLLKKEDLIGPEPAGALAKSASWKELQRMIGLQSVKDSVRSLLDGMQVNYQRELAERSPVQVSLNRVFFGSPGTGKTTVGKLYGQILKELGLLSNGEVVIKNPSDFIGSVVGESEKNTNAILKSTEGKVLIIDEAYMLHGASKNSSGSGNTDQYRTAVVDTLVAEVQSVPGEDRCVLLLGYKEEIEEWFKNSNPGLNRRFALDDAFHFEDFGDEELRKILDMKLKKQEIAATDQAKDVAIGILARARRRLNFGNAGEVENLISRAKSHFQKRESSKPVAERTIDIIFEPQDFDQDFGRETNALENCRKLFLNVVGAEDVIAKLESYIRTASNCRARGWKPEDHIPFNFIFKGPPGTGKTTTAKKMGQIFYDLGFLSSSAVEECTVSDMVAGFVGQTALKTREALERGLGRVLFIDEAYRLAEGQFATEAVNEIVDSLTKPKFFGKMIVVLAGYEEQMNELLSVNPGLSSRFSEEVFFENLSPRNCLALLKQRLKDAEIHVPPMDFAHEQRLLDLFQSMSVLSSWGNGRDVGNISKELVRLTLQSSIDSKQSLSVSYRQILDVMRSSYRQREARLVLPIQGKEKLTEKFATNAFSTPAPSIASKVDILANSAVKEDKRPDVLEEVTELPIGISSTVSNTSERRDVGVSDEVWSALEVAKAQQRAMEQERREILEKNQRGVQRRIEEEAKKKAELEALKAAADKARDDAEALRIRKEQEEARLVHLRALQALRDAEDLARKQREMEERRRKEERRAQEKLRSMGVCPVGYRWIKQGNGYRCAGGSHFVTNAELGM